LRLRGRYLLLPLAVLRDILRWGLGWNSDTLAKVGQLTLDIDDFQQVGLLSLEQLEHGLDMLELRREISVLVVQLGEILSQQARRPQ
jgi:hypothetical protein